MTPERLPADDDLVRYRDPETSRDALLSLGAAVWSDAVDWLYGRAAADTFPTWYRANSLPDLQRLGKESGLSLARLEFITDPSYLAFSEAIFRLACRIERQLPTERRIHLVGILQKGCR